MPSKESFIPEDWFKGNLRNSIELINKLQSKTE